MTRERYLSLAPDGATVWGDAEVFEFDPPRRLVHVLAVEVRRRHGPRKAPSRVTWEIEPVDSSVCKLTMIHDHLEKSLQDGRQHVRLRLDVRPQRPEDPAGDGQPARTHDLDGLMPAGADA